MQYFSGARSTLSAALSNVNRQLKTGKTRGQNPRDLESDEISALKERRDALQTETRRKAKKLAVARINGYTTVEADRVIQAVQQGFAPASAYFESIGDACNGADLILQGKALIERGKQKERLAKRLETEVRQTAARAEKEQQRSQQKAARRAAKKAPVTTGKHPLPADDGTEQSGTTDVAQQGQARRAPLRNGVGLAASAGAPQVPPPATRAFAPRTGLLKRRRAPNGASTTIGDTSDGASASSETRVESEAPVDSGQEKATSGADPAMPETASGEEAYSRPRETPSQDYLEHVCAEQHNPAVKRPANSTRGFPTSWTARIMSCEELALITVPIGEVRAALLPTLRTYGVALVTGVVSEAEAIGLENDFARDVNALLADPMPIGDGTCKGRCNNGKPCRVTEHTSGFQRKCALPLQYGANYCTQHAPSIVERDNTITRTPLPLNAWPVELARLLGVGGTFGYAACARGLPGGLFSWGCRTHANVRKCFGILHDTDDLVTSLDNAFFAPTTSMGATRNAFWPHVDINTTIPGTTACFQGVLYVWSAEGATAASTVVLPGSHTDYFETMMHGAKPKAGHWVTVRSMPDMEERQEVIDAWREKARRVPAPIGSLLLWDSRTLHQGWSGGARLAQAVCWEPREHRSEAALDRKLLLAARGLPSTHWASLGMPHRCQTRPSQRAVVEINGERVGLRGALLSSALRPDSFVAASEAWKYFLAWAAPLTAEQRRQLQGMLQFAQWL